MMLYHIIIYAARRGPARTLPVCHSQKCTGKSIGRQGMVLEHKTSSQKEPMPCRPMPFLV